MPEPETKDHVVQIGLHCVKHLRLFSSTGTLEWQDVKKHNKSKSQQNPIQTRVVGLKICAVLGTHWFCSGSLKIEESSDFASVGFFSGEGYIKVFGSKD